MTDATRFRNVYRSITGSALGLCPTRASRLLLALVVTIENRLDVLPHFHDADRAVNVLQAKEILDAVAAHLMVGVLVGVVHDVRVFASPQRVAVIAHWLRRAEMLGQVPAKGLRRPQDGQVRLGVMLQRTGKLPTSQLGLRRACEFETWLKVHGQIHWLAVDLLDDLADFPASDLEDQRGDAKAVATLVNFLQK